MKPRPRVLLVDDHALMTEGLRAMLEPEHEIVDTVRNGNEVMAAVERCRPDVVLLDLSLPGRSGLEVAASLRETHPDVRVVMLTMHADRLYADEALRVGALGYVLKLARAEELRLAIAEALAGRAYVTPLLSDSEADEGRLVPRGMPTGGGVDALTERQRQILKLIARGQTTADIARSIGLSEKSIEFHRARIRKTLGLKTTAALVRYAVAEKLV